MSVEKAQILVAEDEGMLRVLAVEALEDSGFQVFEASDGVEALEVLKTNPGIVLLLSDVKMPRMDGYALTEAGRATRPDLKVVLMTGYAQQPPAGFQQANKVTVLHKPFSLELLCDVAEKMVSGKD